MDSTLVWNSAKLRKNLRNNCFRIHKGSPDQQPHKGLSSLISKTSLSARNSLPSSTTREEKRCGRICPFGMLVKEILHNGEEKKK